MQEHYSRAAEVILERCARKRPHKVLQRILKWHYAKSFSLAVLQGYRDRQKYIRERREWHMSNLSGEPEVLVQGGESTPEGLRFLMAVENDKNLCFHQRVQSRIDEVLSEFTEDQPERLMNPETRYLPEDLLRQFADRLLGDLAW